jgi:DNA-binding winged helix-turn-helix (wHTH) protein
MPLNLPLEANSADEPVLYFGEFRLDRQLRTLRRGAEQRKLAAKPFATLEFLIENRSRVVPKSELLREVWGAQQDVNTVEQAVRHVRKALADDPVKPRYIETIPGQGYRFIAEVHTPTPPGDAANGLPPSRPSRRRLLYAAAIAAPMVCLAGFAANRLLRQSHRVARVTVSGSSLAALSATGATLWTHEFDAPLQEPPPDETWRTQIVDLDGDGIPEILVVATSARESLSTSEQILCFSSTGKELWRYEPKTEVEFGTPGMKGPWKFGDILVTHGDRASSIWVAVVHAVWWPSFIVRISPTGIVKLAFVNPGNIRSLRRIRTKPGSYILATGVNNGYRRAFVAMLAEDADAAKPPEAADPTFGCVRACPTSRPYRYILLPQSEVGAATLPYSIGVKILAQPGGLIVLTAETPGGGPGGAPSGFFYFSHDLQPEGVGYADGYRQLHESLEKRGRITHSFMDCPEQKNPAIIDVCDENGHWSRVQVPRMPAS